MAKADIAALLALCAAFFIAIGDVIHQRSAHEVTAEPPCSCGCSVIVSGGSAAWSPPPDSGFRRPLSVWGRCCSCRRCW